MSGISTHILDTANGKPAQGITVRLYNDNSQLLSTRQTNADGRIPSMLPPGTGFFAGTYRLIFDVGGYFLKSFFPEVIIVFEVTDSAANYHVPLLISPYGYSTYRGS